MGIEDPLTFVGNAVGLLAVAGKTFYDLVENPRRFRRDFQELGDLAAAKRKRDRGDLSTAVTFLLLTISFAIMMIGAI